MHEPQTKIIACQTVAEELKSILPTGFEMEVLDYGLHNIPHVLHQRLQKAIDHTKPEFSTILVGYGLCANAILGIYTRKFQLVIPRVDDCIALCLGSREEYRHQLKLAPGTFFLSKGWIECGEDPYTEYCAMREKYGHEKALRLTKRYISNYTRLALIKSGDYDTEAYRKYARMVADHFELIYEEIQGSPEYLRNFIQGKWEQDFVVVPPGRKISFDLFYGKDILY